MCEGRGLHTPTSCTVSWMHPQVTSWRGLHSGHFLLSGGRCLTLGRGLGAGKLCSSTSLALLRAPTGPGLTWYQSGSWGKSQATGCGVLFLPVPLEGTWALLSLASPEEQAAPVPEHHRLAVEDQLEATPPSRGSLHTQPAPSSPPSSSPPPHVGPCSPPPPSLLRSALLLLE